MGNCNASSKEKVTEEVNRFNLGIRQRTNFNFDQIHAWVISELGNFERRCHPSETLYIQSGFWTVKRNIGIIQGSFTILGPVTDEKGNQSVFNHLFDLTIDWNGDVIPHKGEVNVAFRLDQSLSLEDGGATFIGPSTDFDLTGERGYVNSFSEYFLEANDYTSISINRKIDHYIAKQNIEYNKLFSTGTHIDTRDQLITRINDNDESNGRSSKKKHRKCRSKHRKCQCQYHKC